MALDGTDAFGRKIDYAVVQAPHALPRIIQLPPEASGNGRYDFVFLSSVIHEHVGDLFAEIRERDVLLHHPFDSFLPVTEFVRGAAADTRVLAIKQTLYRTGSTSAVVDALVDAASAGKEVTAFPLRSPPLYDRVLRELEIYLADNSQAWLLGADSQYQRAEPAAGEVALAAQKSLMEGPG